MSTNSMPKSRRCKPATKPEKPYEDFPLYAHPLGYWSKKVKGVIRHYGRWGRVVKGAMTLLPYDTHWQEALTLYKAQIDDHKLGRSRFVDDLASDDFEKLRADLAKQFGPMRLSNEITRIKSVFNYATDNALIDRAIRFGSEFKKPGKAIIRKHKADNGGNMMEATEIRKLIAAADSTTKAMILLGVNCGFGPTDCATMPLDAVDLTAARIVLEALVVRPKPQNDDDAKLFFITSRGNSFVSGHAAHPITVKIVSLMRELGLHRAGRGPYTMRHVFRTIADEALDCVAIDLIMGHTDPSMGGHNRERSADARLVAVVEHVREWLFGKAEDEGRCINV